MLIIAPDTRPTSPYPPPHYSRHVDTRPIFELQWPSELNLPPCFRGDAVRSFAPPEHSLRLEPLQSISPIETPSSEKLAELFRENYRMLYRFGRRVAHLEHHVDEAISNVFDRLLRHPHQQMRLFRLDPTPRSAFLKKAVLYAILDVGRNESARHRRETPMGYMEGPVDDATLPPLQSDLTAVLVEALCKHFQTWSRGKSPRFVEAIRRVLFEGQDAVKVSHDMGMTHWTVWSPLMRIRNILREMIRTTMSSFS